MTGRQIVHIDMNSYFASVEQQCNPLLRGKPVAIVRKPRDATIVTTASYEAKALGIDTGMPTWEAKRILPRLHLIVEDLNKYAYTSQRIFRILERVSPEVEVFSVDEAFLDITPTAERWGGPLAVARWIKRTIRAELGVCIRSSIGIAPSKLMAKIASESHKPDGLTWIRPEEVDAWLEALPVDAACGINDRTRLSLDGLGIKTLADLGRANPTILRKRFGIDGLYLHLMGKGQDPAPMGSHGAHRPRKSVGHSRVLQRPYPGFEEAKEVLQLLCAKVGRRLRKLGYAGRVVHFHLRSPSGYSAGRQMTLSTPTADEGRVYEACLEIAAGIDLPARLNAISVSVGKLQTLSSVPVQLFDDDRRRERALRAMDAVNTQWGEFTVYPGSLHEVREKSNWTVASIGLKRELAEMFNVE